MKSRMETVRAGIKRLSPSALAGKGRLVVSMMTDNPRYPDPQPSLGQLTAACAALEAATEWYDFSRGRQDLAKRNRCYVELRHLLIGMAAYVQCRSQGDRAVIMSAGFDVKGKRQPSEPLEAPKNMRALRTDFPGVVKLRWGGVKHKQVYEVQVTSGDPSDPGAWRMLVQTGRNHFVVGELPSGQVHYFRAKALGALGAGPLSGIASAKAA
mgnify:CR=1 FL=1